MTHPLVVGTLVGDPRPASRTLNAALALREAVSHALRARGGEPTPSGPLVDAAELAAEVVRPDSTAVRDALENLSTADVLVVASPTDRGLLTAVLDRAPGNWLRGKTAVPLLVAAADEHAPAGEPHLKPLLMGLGASVPGRALFVHESAPATDQTVLITDLGARLAEAGWFTAAVGAAR